MSHANNSSLTRQSPPRTHTHTRTHAHTHTAIVGLKNEDKEREVTPEEGRTLAAKLHADMWTEISPRADGSLPLLHAPHTNHRTRTTRTPHCHDTHALPHTARHTHHRTPHDTRRRLSCPRAEEKENLRQRLAAAVLPALRPMAGDTWVKPTAAELDETVLVVPAPNKAAAQAAPARIVVDAPSDKSEARCLVQ